MSCDGLADTGLRISVPIVIAAMPHKYTAFFSDDPNQFFSFQAATSIKWKGSASGTNPLLMSL